MADKKISQLTQFNQSSWDDNDLIPIVDMINGETKKTRVIDFDDRYYKKVSTFGFDPANFNAMESVTTIDVSDDGDGSYEKLHSDVGSFNPIGAGANDNWYLRWMEAQIGTDNSGFELGDASGGGLTILGLSGSSIQSSSFGYMRNIDANLNAGNGTDAITGDLMTFLSSNLSIANNVTLDEMYLMNVSFNSGNTASEINYFRGVNFGGNISKVNQSVNQISLYQNFASVEGYVNQVSLGGNFVLDLTNNNFNSLFINPDVSFNATNQGFGAVSINPAIEFNGNNSYTNVLQINPGIQSNALATNATLLSIGTPGIDGVENVTGLNINMGNVTNVTNLKAMDITGDVSINGALSFTGALSIGQLQAYYAANAVDGGGTPANYHGLTTAFNGPANTTIANVDAIGVNTAMLITLNTNFVGTSGAFGLGASALALPCVVETHTGSSIDFMNAAVYAINLAGTSTGGTIDTLNLCRSVAVPNGITTINKMRGFAFELPFGDPGTDTWGIYMAPDCHNWIKGALKIGGTAGSTDVEDPGLSLHVEGDTKFDGNIGFFNVAPVAQQTSSGAATAGGTYTATEQTMIQEMYDALRAYGLLT